MSRPSTQPAELLGAVARGAAAGVALHAVHLGLRFLLTPWIVQRAGLEAYGLWSLLFVAFGTVGLHRSGLLGASTAVVAADVARGDLVAARAVLRTLAGLSWGLAAAATAASLALAPALASALGASGELVVPATRLVAWVGVGVALQLAATPLHVAHEARQRHAYLRVAEASTQVGEALLVITLFATGWGLEGLGLAFAARAACLGGAHLATLAAGHGPRELLVGPGRPSRAALARILPLAGALQLLGSAHLAVFAVPRFVIARSLGLAAAGAFEVGRKLVELTGSLGAQALTPIAPAAAAWTATGDSDGQDLGRAAAPLRAATRFVGAAGALPLAAVCAAADPVALAWLGAADPDVTASIRLLAPAAAVHLCTGPATSVLRGVRRPRHELAYAFAWLVALAALVPLAAAHGLVGAIAATAACQIGASAWLLVCASRAVGLPGSALLLEAVRGLVAPALGGAVGALTARWVPVALDRSQAAVHCVGIGAAVGAVSLAALATLVANTDERRAALRLGHRAFTS